MNAFRFLPLCALLLASSCWTCSRRDYSEPEVVFLLHGMWRTRVSMFVLARRLRAAGYRTVNVAYSQKTKSLDAITDLLHESIMEHAVGGRYHLIGHSLGNVIIRNGFKKGYPPGLGRIVMLAPPNRPAKLAKRLKDVFLYKWATGDSGQKLSQAEFYETLPVPDVEFGVIAGNRGLRLVSKEPNDGIVLLEATKLAGMKDFKALHHGHTFIMNARDTFELCKRFLETGRFVVPLPPGR